MIFNKRKDKENMSKMATVVKEQRKNSFPENATMNFMGGISYVLDPLTTMKMITASSIMGEPQYYRRGEFAQKGVADGKNIVSSEFKPYFLLDIACYDKKTTSDVMEEAIDRALDYDYAGTIQWAEILRTEYLMRLNPQVIMVRAAIHPNRVDFTKKYPNEFARVNQIVMARADEPASQLTYYLYKKGSKRNIPNLLKRSWAKKLETLTPYEVYKYRNAEVGMIDTVRICHAHSPVIDELMQTGTVNLPEDNQTWERLHAGGMSWRYILQHVKIGHMALLRNLRAIFTEETTDDYEFLNHIVGKLKAGVKNGKQFPYRYKTAYNRLKGSEVRHKRALLDALEECIDIACENMPKLKGKVCCLSDNSGSAWRTMTSEYGTTKIANIDNLSAAITARNADEGYIGKFGDRLFMIPVSKKDGVLSQVDNLEQNPEYSVGESTENGIWLFFDRAIKEKEHWDTIFIYSDMQAGHGGLYGTPAGINAYREAGFACQKNSRYIDVAKLIAEYRKKVNPKVNVYCVQTAGYNNVLIPEIGYRTSVMYGWTGKELLYAATMNQLWDEADAKKE